MVQFHVTIQLPECVNIFALSSNSLRRSTKSFALMKRRKERKEEKKKMDGVVYHLSKADKCCKEDGAPSYP